VFIELCSVPDGTEEEHNIVVSEWGVENRKVGEHFRWHDDIALSLRGLDLPAAVRMSGSRFSVLTGQVARLERALTNYFLDYFTGLHPDKKYEEVAVPLIVTRSTLESTGILLVMQSQESCNIVMTLVRNICYFYFWLSMFGRTTAQI
jgi:seryl-tRNA synthetase